MEQESTGVTLLIKTYRTVTIQRCIESHLEANFSLITKRY